MAPVGRRRRAHRMTARTAAAERAPERLEFLADPRHYPERPRCIELVETHFAWVFLGERYAYKMKKPMRQAGMDYRSLAARRRGCLEELRLNRRLAPTVYLDVVPLSRGAAGALTLGGGGRVVDWLVKMQRLPAARMLDRTIAARTIAPGDLEAVAGLLAGFFRAATRRPMRPAAYRARLSLRARENARQLSAPDLGLDRERIVAVADAQLEFIAGAAALVGARGAQLIDGHGDLRPEHVCLGPPLCVIDCLEFDRDLRRIDPLEELAFLALECARAGAADAGEALLARCAAALPDPAPGAIVHFYASQRALTRAKVVAWQLRDPQYACAVPPQVRATSYLADAERAVQRALAAIRRRRGSLAGGEGPLAQQRRQRLACQQAPHGRAEQRCDGQHAQLARCAG